LAYTFDENQLNKIESVFQEELQPLGLHEVILIDMAGNVIVESNNGKMKHDIYSLAAGNKLYIIIFIHILVIICISRCRMNFLVPASFAGYAQDRECRPPSWACADPATNL